MENTKAVFAYHNSVDDTSDFVLECMRQGRADIIREFAEVEQQKDIIEQLFGNDRPCALRAFMVLWVEAAKIADEIGLPSEVVDKTFEKCINKSQHATTPWMLNVVTIEYLIEFAEIIAATTCNMGCSPIFYRFQKYVRININKTLEIQDIARALNISKSHLSHTIKEETGDTVHQWITKEKVNVAKIMLSNQKLPMSKIWRDLGFCSQSHFAKSFNSVTGMSPSQFRASMHQR